MFCERYREFESRVGPRYRNRHEAGAVMQTDYAGHTIPVIDPATGREHRAQIFVAVLGHRDFRRPQPACVLGAATMPRAAVQNHFSCFMAFADGLAEKEVRMRGDGHSCGENGHICAPERKTAC